MSKVFELFNTYTETQDGGHFDVIDEEALAAQFTKTPQPELPVSNQNPEYDGASPTKAFEPMSMKSMNTEVSTEEKPKPVREWIWADVPSEIRIRLEEWRDMFVKAIPNAEPVENLHITLFHELLDFLDDLRFIITTVSNARPAEAVLCGLRAFRTENHGIAVAIEVNSPQLVVLRRELEKGLQHTPSEHKYTPHITLAYIPTGEGTTIEGLQLFGIAGQQFVIDTVNAGQKKSFHPCVMLGANQEWISRFEPTPISTKGMSTLSGESGGYLVKPKMVDIQTLKSEPEVEPEDDDDEDDEQWISQAMDMADSLDQTFGDF